MPSGVHLKYCKDKEIVKETICCRPVDITFRRLLCETFMCNDINLDKKCPDVISLSV